MNEQLKGKLLKLVCVDVVDGGLIQVDMKDENNKYYYAFFPPDKFFSRLGGSMYSSHKEWTAKENLKVLLRSI